MNEASPPPRLDASSFTLTRRFLTDPFTLLAEAARAHGDIFSMRLLGFGEWVFVGSPELVREMFQAPADVLVAGEVNRSQMGFMLGSDATFTLDGEAHRQRQRLVHPYLNGRRALEHVPAMREIALGTLAKLPRGKPFAFLPHAHRAALDVMIHVMFGGSDPGRAEELASLFDEFATKGLRSLLIAMPYLRWDLGPYSPWGRILRMRRRVMEEFSTEIRQRIERRGVGNASGFISQLAAAEQQDGSRLETRPLLSEALNLLFASHETTGNVIAWTLETVSSRPEVERRLREELDSVLEGEPVTAGHLDHLRYLHATIHETIRYRPLAPMAGVRLVKQPYPIGGFVVPPGALMAQCFPLMARRCELFADPESFDPAHFFGRKFRPYEWNPFGGGTRMCVGRVLAEVELKVVLATLFQNAAFRLAQDHVRPVRQGLFFSPSKGLRLTVELPRRPQDVSGSA